MKKDTQAKLAPQKIQLKGKNGAPSTSATILPGLGANLVSFKADGTEFIYWNENNFLADNTFSGAFNMFPTPCRLAGCAYEFEGRMIKQKKHGEEIFIHGLIRDEAMQSENDGDSITCRLAITPKHPVFEGFPFKCIFTIKHALGYIDSFENKAKTQNAALTVSFKLENKDSRNIPFGYGIHPYWIIHGRRNDVLVRIPGENVMDMVDLVPTGTCSPVQGTELDLSAPKNIADLDLDNIFWKRKPGETAEMIFKKIGKRILIESSPEFTHMIAYTPPGQTFFCVENLTTSPNAPNLAAKGMGDIAHMLVVPPGQAIEGWVRYIILKQ